MRVSRVGVGAVINFFSQDATFSLSYISNRTIDAEIHLSDRMSHPNTLIVKFRNIDPILVS